MKKEKNIVVNMKGSKLKSASLQITVESRRVYLRVLGDNAASIKLDVTPLWHFFKEVMKAK